MPEKRIGILSQLVPPKATWNVEDIPDQRGKIVIITGGDQGIGKETARVLLSKNAKVYIATRSIYRAEEAINELMAKTGKKSIFFLRLDLADLDSVRAAAAEYIAKESELHTLYNNGGITYAQIDWLTSQGHDMQFGTNVLGHFYFTKLLLPVLTATAKKWPGLVRVVNVSSICHYFGASDGIRWSTLDPGDGALAARRELGIPRLYGQSRLGNILFSNELARRYGGEGLVSISLSPGPLNTDISGYTGSFFNRLKLLLLAALCVMVKGREVLALAEERPEDETSAQGRPSWVSATTTRYRAITSLYAGTAFSASKLNGKYLTAWARVTLPNKKALNPRLGHMLWDWCEEQVKDKKAIA